ncbi:MAG TPA: sensor histidine kinase [Xanthomonadaceae bacterium]|nr:sensor histidine kinase [Xanthomonadaceae bacterium]
MSGRPDGSPPLELRRELALLQRRHARLLERVAEDQRRFSALARSVWRVQEDERRRISRELHDGMGQNLTALKHRLSMIGEELAGDAPAQAHLQEALALCERTLQDARRLSRLLRPQILDDLGLEAALNWLARSIGESGRIDIQVQYAAPDQLDADLTTLVFRTVQEALTNVLRHAGASHALVRVVHRDSSLVVLVWDDGRGCDTAAALAAAGEGRSGGLSGIRERVELGGGELHFDSAPGAGTRLRFTVPLQHEGSEQ